MAEAQIPVPNVPLVDPKTGNVSREWRWFFHAMWLRSGGAGDITGLLTADIGSTVQAWNAELDALAAFSSTGLMVRTAAVTYVGRTLTAPAAGISVSNGDGVAGNPTLALANDLAALEALGSTGIAVRTAGDAWAQRAIAAATTVPGAVGVSITNGNGVSGNPTIAISTSATDSITSGTTQTQAGATALTTRFNRVTTHGNVDDGVKLPNAVAGLSCVILNDTATADLQVWPATEDAIEAGAADAVGVTKIANGVATTYEAVDGTTWYITNQHTTP